MYLCGSALRCECAYFENVYGGCKIGLAKMSAIALTLLAITRGFSDTLISLVELTNCTRCVWLKLMAFSD